MNAIDGLPRTVTGSVNVTRIETRLPAIAMCPKSLTLGPTASTRALGNSPDAAGFRSFPALSRIAAPSGRTIGPATRTPAGAKSPDCTPKVNVSDLLPLPRPFHAA
jgi:hypothetical protein